MNIKIKVIPRVRSKSVEINSTEMKDFRPYRNLRITRCSLSIHLKSYYQELRSKNIKPEPCPEILILKNIISRYENSSDIISEQDIDILINLIQMNLNHRHTQEEIYQHDIMFDTMIDVLSLGKFIQRRVYFNILKDFL